MTRRDRRRRAGTAALEFAIVLPALLLVVFAMLEFGWLLTTRLVLVQAVDSGAQSGGTARDWLGEDPAQFARTALRESYWIGDLPADAIVVEELPQAAAAPRRLRVAVERLPYEPLVGYLPDALIPQSLSAVSVVPLR